MIGLVIAHWFLEVLEKKNAYNEKKKNTTRKHLLGTPTWLQKGF